MAAPISLGERLRATFCCGMCPGVELDITSISELALHFRNTHRANGSVFFNNQIQLSLHRRRQEISDYDNYLGGFMGIPIDRFFPLMPETNMVIVDIPPIGFHEDIGAHVVSREVPEDENFVDENEDFNPTNEEFIPVNVPENENFASTNEEFIPVSVPENENFVREDEDFIPVSLRKNESFIPSGVPEDEDVTVPILSDEVQDDQPSTESESQEADVSRSPNPPSFSGHVDNPQASSSSSSIYKAYTEYNPVVVLSKENGEGLSVQESSLAMLPVGTRTVQFETMRESLGSQEMVIVEYPELPPRVAETLSINDESVSVTDVTLMNGPLLRNENSLLLEKRDNTNVNHPITPEPTDILTDLFISDDSN